MTKLSGIFLFLLLAASVIPSSAQTLTTLYSFCSQTGCTDGSYPDSSLLAAGDGNLYGMTTAGGNLNSGTIFKITPAGSLTTTYSFCSQPNCIDGSAPSDQLVQDADGSIYGATAYGGRHSSTGGTIFKTTASGNLTSLYSFCALPNCADGSGPDSALVKGSNGSFYGTTFTGGDGFGTVFSITTSGALTTLHTFVNTDGAGPEALILGADGNFYGAASTGGAKALFRVTAKVVVLLGLPCSLVSAT